MRRSRLLIERVIRCQRAIEQALGADSPVSSLYS
jgi:hypothetical protein